MIGDIELACNCRILRMGNRPRERRKTRAAAPVEEPDGQLAVNCRIDSIRDTARAKV
jgi:hypothetical protein